MAKNETQDSANLAKASAREVSTDTGNVMQNAGNYQAAAAQGAKDTLDYGQKNLLPLSTDTYRNFAQTGGFSPTDETAFRNRATRGVAGTYDVLRQAADRTRAAAGGLGTGGTDVALARQGSQAVASANTDAEAALKQQENQNKLAGAGGLSNLYGQTNQLYNTQTNQVTAQGEQILQALGIRYQTKEEAAQILAQLSKNQGVLGNIQQIAGIAGGALTGAFGASPSGKIGG